MREFPIDEPREIGKKMVHVSSDILSKVREKEDRMKNTNVLVIEEDVRIPGTDILLEKGDKIRVIEGQSDRPSMYQESRTNYAEISQQIIQRTGMNVEPIQYSDIRLLIQWLEDNFNIKQELELKGKISAFTNRDSKNRQSIIFIGDGEGTEIALDSFIEKGTDWSSFRDFITYPVM